MTFRSLLHLLREWAGVHVKELDHEAHHLFQEEHLKKHGHYKQQPRSRDLAPFPGHDTQVDVFEEPVDRKTKTTRKGYKVRRWVRGKEVN